MCVTSHVEVRDYYSATINQHGATPFGVDWPSAASQYLRFVQLLRICDFSAPFSLNDFGCGYGALLEYLAYRHPAASIAYRGVDISPPMIEAARSLWKQNENATFFLDSQCRERADYSLASGVFNVCLGVGKAKWEAGIETILRDLRQNSRRGFSVNFMLPLESAADKPALYRVAPQRWLDFCETDLHCETEQISNYGLREFTLLARIPSEGWVCSN
jgi:SAM-dependent methyltransferase